MKIVVQSFDINNNIWYNQLITQLLQTDFDIIVVVSKSCDELITKFGKITYIYTQDNLYEYISFKKIHEYREHEYIIDDMYFFLHDTCQCGNEFNVRLKNIYSIMSTKSFDYAPIGINRKFAKDYHNKYKTKFNICICSFKFMSNENFNKLFNDEISKKTAVAIELGNHLFSFRMWNNVIVDESIISQVIQSKRWKVINGKKKLHNYIPIIDLHKYVSKDFLKK